ncbi:MAG: HypC/HybG/HupF family hydrogenase formation chaperone [Phycisphaerales bacterium]|nr:HypC/HybG/HupF family hydrogenase formation chaperone [Phycisphaerales bacterium]
MCLAVPARVVACEGEDAVVDLLGNRLLISRVMTPTAGVGSWVLVHAGFSITELDEEAARETWDYLHAAFGEDGALAEEFNPTLGETHGAAPVLADRLRPPAPRRDGTP